MKWYRQGLHPDQIIDEFNSLENITSSENKISKQNHQCCSAFAQEETLKPFIIVLALLGLVPLTGIMSVTFFAMELFEGEFSITIFHKHTVEKVLLSKFLWSHAPLLGPRIGVYF